MSVLRTSRLISFMVLIGLLLSVNVHASTPGKNSQKNTLFKLAPADVPKNLEVVDGVYLQISPDILNGIYQQKAETLELDIPTGVQSKISLQLERKNFFTNNFVVTKRTANGPQAFDYQPGLYYHGSVQDDPNSMVAISFFEDKIMAVISYDGDDHNLGISTDATKIEDDVYLLFAENSVLVPSSFECHTNADDVVVPADLGNSAAGFTTTTNSVKMYMECDYLMYQDFNSSVTETTDFVTNMFNVVSALYDNDEICMELNEVYVWAVQDPYPTSSSSAALDAFESQLNGVFNGDLAHLLSTANVGNGGLAYVDVLCYKPLGIGYSNIDPYYSNLPSFSWTVEVVTHEIGHNLGSPHTHSCSWPGGAIDNCFCPEGSCSPGPDPGSPGGTIMSYCHLTGSETYGNCTIPGFPNPGIDLNLGFGPQPKALITNNINAASCLTACSGSGGGGGGGGGSALDCSSAVELFSDVTYNGNTNNGTANISTYSCANYSEPGNEVVHFFTAPVTGTAEISYNENVAGYIDLFVLSSCNPSSCFLYFDGGPGVTGTMDVVAGNTYYFVTDVYTGGAGGAYDLTISFPDGACQCDNPNAITCDNFETYNQGALGPQTVCWSTWTGTQGGVEDGLVNMEQAASGNNSVKMEGSANGGPQDIVFLPGNYTSGHYQLNFKLYIPSGKSAYYNLQHIFVPGTQTYQWASEVFFNTNGTGTLNAGVENAASFSYSQGTWIDVVQEIDIDNDLTTLSIDGTAIYSWPFSYQANDISGGTNALVAVNFFPVDDTHLYWIDDIELIEYSVTPVMAVTPANQNVSATAGTVGFSVSSNIDWTVSDNASWLTVTPTGASGNSNVDATFTENMSTTERVATLTMTGDGITQTVTVTQAGAVVPISATVTTTSETCYNAVDGTINLEVNGGTPGYTYAWNNGASTEDIGGLSAGNYTCTVTDAMGLTFVTSTVTVVGAPQMTAQVATPGTLNCNDLSLVLDATASTTGNNIAANWATADGNIISGGNTLTPVIDAPGTYWLTLTYNNNPTCVEITSVVVMEVVDLNATLSSTPATGGMNDGTAIAEVTGGSPPYQYAWGTSPVQTTQLATNLAEGTYTVTVTDADNCILVETVTVGALTDIDEVEGLNVFNLFPNPSSGLVSLEIGLEEVAPFELIIYNVLGSVVWEGKYKVQSVTQQLDLSDLSNAIYFVELQVGEAVSTRKLLLNK